MPVLLFRDIALNNLKSIDFEPPDSSFTYSPTLTLKNTILTGNGLDVYILNERRFKVSMQPKRFYEALSTGFHYSFQRVSRQKASLDLLVNTKNLPSAWTLVTSYYAAFYAATELTRLMGIYVTNLESEHIDSLNAMNQSTEKLKSKGSFICNKVELNRDESSIEITFSACGERPHQITWTSLLSKMNSSNDSRLLERVRSKRVNLLKEVLSLQDQSWLTPSQLRNNWNYSTVDAYGLEADKKAALMESIITKFDFNSVKSWGDSKKRQIDDRQQAASLAYVTIIVCSALNELSYKVLKKTN